MEMKNKTRSPTIVNDADLYNYERVDAVYAYFLINIYIILNALIQCTHIFRLICLPLKKMTRNSSWILVTQRIYPLFFI